MKILIASHRFYPSIGGIEQVSMMLANEFVSKGHEVKVITQTPSNNPTQFTYNIIRQPNARDLYSLVKWCDIFIHNNISLQTAWPLLMIRRPWLVINQTWIARTDGRRGWQDYLKHFFLRFATCVSISRAVAEHFNTPSVVIGNPYESDIFNRMPEISRVRDLVFVGRLVSDKGLDLLIRALGELKNQQLTPSLTVVGSGPEKDNLKNLATVIGVSQQIEFVGIKTGQELAKLLNKHKIMIIPSRWSEPFGIVALEGAACGCVVVGSEGGGLKEVIGPCGTTFPNGNVQAITDLLAQLLSSSDNLENYRDPEKVDLHLSRYKKAKVTQEYLKVIETISL